MRNGIEPSFMSLVRLNIKSRIELETRVLAAALRQSFERGDTLGASLAHRQLFTLLKDTGRSDLGDVATIRISDGVLPGLNEYDESRPVPLTTPEPVVATTRTGEEMRLESGLGPPFPEASEPPRGQDSLAARLYGQPLFGEYRKSPDENATPPVQSQEIQSDTGSTFRAGFMRHSARLHAAARAASANHQSSAAPSPPPPEQPVENRAGTGELEVEAEPAAAEPQSVVERAPAKGEFAASAAAPNMVPPEPPPARAAAIPQAPSSAPAQPAKSGQGAGNQFQLYELLDCCQTSPFDQIHTNFLGKARNTLRQIKINRAQRYDRLADLQKLWIAHDILMDPVTRTDYDFRDLGVRGNEESAAGSPERDAVERVGARTPLRIGELLQCAG